MTELTFPAYVDEVDKNLIKKWLNALKNHNTNNIIKKLKDELKFWDGFAELEISFILSNFYDVCLEPRLGNKKVDVKTTIEGKTHYFEVSQRGSFSKKEKASKNMAKGVTYIPDLEVDIKEKICEESKQLKFKPSEGFGYVIININNSTLNKCEISQALFGHTYTNIRAGRNYRILNNTLKRMENIEKDCPDAEKVDVFIFYERIKDKSCYNYKGWFHNKRCNHTDIEKVIMNLFPTLLRLKI